MRHAYTTFIYARDGRLMKTVSPSDIPGEINGGESTESGSASEPADDEFTPEEQALLLARFPVVTHTYYSKPPFGPVLYTGE